MTSIKESIISSTGTGKSMTEKFFNDYGIKDWEKNFSGNYILDVVDIKDDEFEFTVNAIDYIKILKVKGLKSFKNFPKFVKYLFVEDSIIENFSGSQSIENIFTNNCDVRSFKDLPESVIYLGLGNPSVRRFSSKDVVKKTGLKPTQFNLYGYIKENYGIGIRSSLVLGKNDIEAINDAIDEYEKILKKKCPKLKYIRVNTKNLKGGASTYTAHQGVSMKFGFLNDEDCPNGILQNGIYLIFNWDLEECALFFKQEGHIELTAADKEGKYKYFALKGFTDPYKDNGGKKFRQCRMNDFTAKQLDDKLSDWICAVAEAAVKDQGGELKRK